MNIEAKKLNKEEKMFELLVTDKSNLKEIMAYCLYKLKKIDYVKTIKDRPEIIARKEAMKEWLEDFQKKEIKERNKYLIEAEELIEKLINGLLEEEILQIENEKKEIKNEKKEIENEKKEIKKTQNTLKLRDKYCNIKNRPLLSFAIGIGQGCLCNIIWTGLVVLIVLGKGTDIIDFFIKKLSR